MVLQVHDVRFRRKCRGIQMSKRFSAMILLIALRWPTLAVEQCHVVVVGGFHQLDGVAKTVAYFFRRAI